MSDILNPINVGSVVKKLRHIEEQSKNVSKWFETETLEINFGETTGRPSPDITFRTEFLAQFLQTGWSIDSVMSQTEGGVWTNVSGGTIYTKSQTLYPTRQYTSGAGTSSSGIDTELLETYEGNIDVYLPSDPASGTVVNPTPISLGKSVNVPSTETPAYWAAYQRIRLKRRRLVAEKVMQSMMDSFTSAYNAGRAIEDGRYNEIVALYSLMLGRSESEGNAIVSNATNLMPLAKSMAEEINRSIKKAESAADAMSQKSLANRVADVNRQFDALLAQHKAQMITNGTYNATVWPSVAAGIERQRSEALDKATEAGTSVSFNAKQAIATLKSASATQILSAMQGVATAADQRKITVVEMRNTVLKWMLDYIGTREESYPELEEISTVAERMGFSVGSAGSVL